MRDPLDELKSLSGDLFTRPLPPEVVRRRGDRMRRRRGVAHAVAAAAVAVVVSAGVFAAGGLTGAEQPVGPIAPAPTRPTTAANEPVTSPSVTDVPAEFPMEQGLPEAGGDVPEWARAHGPDVPLSAVACGGPEDLSATRPVDSRRVEVAPPDESAWRHLLLFRDAASATQAYATLRSTGLECVEPGGATADPMEMRWSVDESRGTPTMLALDGLMYASGTDVRVPGRALTRVLRVGNALIVARVDDASSAAGTDDAARELEGDVARIAEAMCVFAEEPCESP